MKRSTAPALACALFFALVLTLAAAYIPHRSIYTATAQGSPQRDIRELFIDDSRANCAAGLGQQNRGRAGFGWANKLTPPAYPATLRSITIGFNRRNQIPDAVMKDALYRIVVFLDPEMDGPSDGQTPDATFTGRVRGTDDFMTFNLITPLTITAGSFVVGAIDDIGGSIFPALLDTPGRSTPPGSESFITSDSGTDWRRLSEAAEFSQAPPCDPSSGATSSAGSWLIRAGVELGTVFTLTSTRIQDPLAVEPWDVTFNTTQNQAFVTNFVSDNLSIIEVLTSTVRNMPVGDGPGGGADGPFGVIVHPNDLSVYITLFGSNTIPTKEFPTDYSTVGPGRVAVLVRQANGTFAQTLQINVGKGPGFPAIANTTNTLSGVKLYVPCGGDDRVDIIDTSRNVKIGEVAVGDEPTSCTTSIDNSKVYVTNFRSGTVSVIDTRTDQNIKTIPLFAAAAPPVIPTPWNAEISPTNGNLYVTIRGTLGESPANGSIAVIDTCKDELVRFILDDTTRGTPAGSAGASGIPAPVGPLARDPASGLTPGAGGGGGGPFGIAACKNTPEMVFTNDGLGLIGLFDSRIDQVVSAPALASCPKPRGVACSDNSGVPPSFPHRTFVAFVACGQPDNSVIAVRFPDLPENIADVPVIESINIGGNKLVITGRGFTSGTRIEVIARGSLACLTFEKEPTVKRNGTELNQKGRLSDGRKLKNVDGIIRVINEDGSVRLFTIP